MEENSRRVVDLEGGRAMVVTDLHGDWDAYQRYRDRFTTLQAQGSCDYFILTGDLIHFMGPAEKDFSLQIVLDVLKLREELGDRLISLLGNHELPHIYSIILQKGDYLFTPRFQAAMGVHRSHIMSLFDSLPFFVRSQSGVSICHAGASAEAIQKDALDRLFNFSHQQILEETRKMIPPEKRPSIRETIGQIYGKPYEEIVKEMIAVDSPDDPRYDDFLIGNVAAYSQDFDLLWQVMTTRNEWQYGQELYGRVVEVLLDGFSAGYHPQKVLVSGHIDCQGGYDLVNSQHLRIASSKNAHPREEGRYLLLDLEQRVETAEDLVSQLESVFRVSG